MKVTWFGVVIVPLCQPTHVCDMRRLGRSSDEWMDAATTQLGILYYHYYQSGLRRPDGDNV